MGNCLGFFSSSRKQLARAAAEGDAEGARKLLEAKPGLARSSGFSSPLHIAAAGGHFEIVLLLLEHGAGVNSRNFYGLTPLMEACRSGCWEAVQALLVFDCDVSKASYWNGRTALHYAAEGGHAACIRLLVAGFLSAGGDEAKLPGFVNQAASSGVTALHLAALSGNADCVRLLLDLHAAVSAEALCLSSPAAASIGAGSTPLHYAASTGNLKSCQVLIARGASRSAVNSHGYLPVDVAKSCGWIELVPLLSINSNLTVPDFPASLCPSLVLANIIKLARQQGMPSPAAPPPGDDSDPCAVCLERACTVAAEGCGHGLCIRCALCLCSTSSTIKCESEGSAPPPPAAVPCPMCREGIVAFRRLPSVAVREVRITVGGHGESALSPLRKQSTVVPIEEAALTETV
ncbi:putative E3 ubiquitin-protein ligase XBOS36 [Curcuma longa]|uniref:putative E3 ubiquitin-protein ligase XBOS36 n=1 Tax=Curcuma longa TaxID=136217 RepID=UPI003D9F4447